MKLAARALIAALAIVAGLEIRPASSAAAAGQAASSPVMIRVGLLRGGSYDVSSIPIEAYVARVLAGEAARESPPAALEALAVAVRTFVMANRGRHRADNFDVCDQTHCQVLRAATAASERAAQATAGQSLYFNGELASIFYSASCGGQTARPSSVWPGAADPAYLPSQHDEACEGQPEWEAEIRASDLQRALAGAGFKGTLRGARVAARDDSGRVARIRFDGLTPADMSGQDLRMAVAQLPTLPQVRSTTFELRALGDSYRFTGHGSGHGVGLCVIGSVNLAAGGATAAAILEKYFPGTTLGPASAPRLTGVTTLPSGRGAAVAPVPVAVPARPEIVVWLPGGDEGERDALLGLASSARDDLAGALGVAPPSRLTVRVHATSGAYEGATGRPWYTSGAVVGGEIHLSPLAALRDRGMLERTVRRQMARTLTASALGARPLWVQEGASLFFGDGGAASARDSRVACPADQELAQPVSAGALADAWARARACFARQMSSGRSWRDVR